MTHEFNIVGRNVSRTDSRSKVTGTAMYTDDFKLPGMLYGKILRSPIAHGKILNIDVSKAKSLPGVKCVITGQDTPKIKYGNWRLFPQTQDEYPLAVDKVRFVGDEVAAVTAIDKDTAEEALKLIKVEYQELPGVFDVDKAIAKGAPVIHDITPNNISIERKIEFGNVDIGLDESDYVREDIFRVPAVNHAYMEPCSTLAKCDIDGRITIWTSTQTPYIVQCLLASTLGMRENDVRVIKPAVGGGFGGKMEMRSWDFCAAFMAQKTGRPVKITLTREEEFIAGRRRHPMKIWSRVGFKKDGTLMAKDLKVLLDGGAYNSMGPTATFLCGYFGAMLYRMPNYRFLGHHVYTNKPPSGAMRGFGAPQSLFAGETQMNMVAEALGIDPIDIRIKNAMQPGDVIPEVATVSSCGFTDSLKEAKKISNWTEKRTKLKDGKGIGVACYSFISGGVFNWFNTQYPFSAAEVRAFADGTVHLLTMASDIGQGSDTVLKQILAEELGLKMEDIRLTAADTAMTPQADLGSWGSRVTLMAGNAVVDAARQIKDQLAGAVFSKFNLNVIFKVEFKDGLVFADGKPDRSITFGEAVAAVQKANRGVPLVARGHYTPRGKGIVTPTFSFGTQVAQVDVDKETGVVKVDRLWTAHDCGTAINPMSVEGQLEGSVHMGLGYALNEQLIVEEGYTLNQTFLDYKIPSAKDMPPGESVCIDTYEPEGPLGAKEAGEGLVSPTAPAIGEAVFHATGFRCKELPITPEKVLNGIDALENRED